jgi:hypothetical protein
VLERIASQTAKMLIQNRLITQLAQQVAEQTGSDPQSIEQVIGQIAIKIAEEGGNSVQAITQMAEQVAGTTTAAEDGGEVSQSIAQLAEQLTAGEGGDVT